MVHDGLIAVKKLNVSRFWKIFIRGFPKKVLTLGVEQFTFHEVVVCSGSERVFENTNRVICEERTVCWFFGKLPVSHLGAASAESYGRDRFG
jgi:hypothetical protein